jgi:hypothetical protein
VGQFRKFVAHADKKWEFFLAGILLFLVIRSVVRDPPDYFFAALQLSGVILCLAWAWPLNVKEYLITLNEQGISFSRYLVTRREVLLEWKSIKEIRKELVFMHMYGIGSHYRFRFSLASGKSLYLVKSFGPEFENALAKAADENGVPVLE